jgi:glycosyltransferase involved in cell wall biosynthesis
MNSARVLIVFSSSELGGAERSLTRMALAPSRVEYRLATLDGEGPWCEWVRAMGREPVVFGHRRIAGEHGKFDWQALVALWRYVRRERIDVIYVCGVRAAFVLRWLKIFMPGVRLIQGVRWNPGSNSRLDRGFRFVERWFHGLVDGYITNSRIAANTLIQRCKVPARCVQVIYNGLAEIPAEIPSLAERPLEVLTVANYSPRKGHREYLKAVQLVVAVVPDARFVFVGRDDMSGEIQRDIETAGLSHAVRCEGFQADVSAYFRRGRVCVLPSLWGEGCPTSLLESLAWGVPVVAYAVDGVAELIANGVNGFLVAPGDKEALAARVVTLLGNIEIAERYGQAGRKIILEKFSLINCASAHAAYLQHFDFEERK